ncbi:hypothetical protein [Streptomyces sp. NPDC007088]|uniref:hypothetical protein n=1 Tax=Streptomyces sp. NPDC007088 TaxID=3364773 RepID=UPI003673C871
MGVESVVAVMTVKPSAFAAPFHHLLTRPVVEVDGLAYEGRWGTWEIPLSLGSGAPGEHRVTVYFRYRTQRTARLGESWVDIAVAPTERRVRLTARLGPANGSTFRITAHADGLDVKRTPGAGG